MHCSRAHPMQISKLFSAAGRASVPLPRSSVVVCVKRAGTDLEGLDEEELLTLVRRFHVAVVDVGVARYEGCDDFSSESRLHFSSFETHRVAAIATEIVSRFGWGDCVHVRVSDSPCLSSMRPIPLEKKR